VKKDSHGHHLRSTHASILNEVRIFLPVEARAADTHWYMSVRLYEIIAIYSEAGRPLTLANIAFIDIFCLAISSHSRWWLYLQSSFWHSTEQYRTTRHPPHRFNLCVGSVGWAPQHRQDWSVSVIAFLMVPVAAVSIVVQYCIYLETMSFRPVADSPHCGVPSLRTLGVNLSEADTIEVLMLVYWYKFLF